MRADGLSQAAPYLKIANVQIQTRLDLHMLSQIVRKIIRKINIYPDHQWLYIQENWGFNMKSQFFTLGL